MIVDDLHFVLPQAANLILAFLIFLVLFWLLFNRQQNFQNKFLANLVVKSSLLIFWTKAFALCVVWTLACIALMQPFGNERYPEGEKIKKWANSQKSLNARFVQQKKAHDILILIDVSASMSVPDAREGLTRLTFAKEIADEIVRELRGENVALYSFTSEALELVPLTSDYLFARLLLRDLQINQGGGDGTNILKTLQEMRRRYFEKPSERLKTVILLSDGGDNHLELSAINAHDQEVHKILQPIVAAKSQHLRVFTIGLGSRQGALIPNLSYQGKSVSSALDQELMEKLAKEGEGLYIFANQFSAPEIAQQVIKQFKKSPVGVTEETITRTLSSESKVDFIRDWYYQTPLGIAIILLAFILFWPDVWSKEKLPSSYFSQWFSSFAFLLLLQNANLTALIHHDSDKSLRQAAAYVESHSYGLAEEAYHKILAAEIVPRQRAIVMYNLGCTFFDEKKWGQALAAFNTALLIDSSWPLLTYRAKSNQALTLLEQISTSQLSLLEAIKSIELILSNLDAAQEAYCQLQKMSGASSCETNANLMRMRALAKQILSQKQNPVEAILNLSLQDAFIQLLKEIERAVVHLDFLINLNLQSDPSLQMSYQGFFIDEEKKDLPFWSALQQKLEINKHKEESDGKNEKLFLLAKKQFEQAIGEMENKALEKSQESFKAAAELIKELIKALPSTPPSKKSEERESSQALQKLSQSKEPPISKEEGGSSVKEILELILQMEQEDRLPSPPQTERTKGLRPW